MHGDTRNVHCNGWGDSREQQRGDDDLPAHRNHPACRPEVVTLSTFVALKATPERSPMDHGVATSPVTLAGWPGATAGASPANLTEMISGWLSPSTINGTANNGAPFSSVRGCLDSKSRTGSTAPATTKLIPDVSIGRRIAPPRLNAETDEVSVRWNCQANSGTIKGCG